MADTPKFTREDYLAHYEREKAARKRKAEATVAHLSGVLRFFGVERVTAKFDGSGDDGSIEPAAYHPTLPADLPFGFSEQFPECWLPFMSPSWEINAGSFGTLTLDVATGEVHEEIEVRDEEVLESWDDEEAE